MCTVNYCATSRPDSTIIAPVSVYHRASYAERYSRYRYTLLRRVLARRQTFFHDVQALMRYMVFDNWDHLMEFMIRGLELESQVDTS